MPSDVTRQGGTHFCRKGRPMYQGVKSTPILKRGIMYLKQPMKKSAFAIVSTPGPTTDGALRLAFASHTCKRFDATEHSTASRDGSTGPSHAEIRFDGSSSNLAINQRGDQVKWRSGKARPRYRTQKSCRGLQRHADTTHPTEVDEIVIDSELDVRASQEVAKTKHIGAQCEWRREGMQRMSCLELVHVLQPSRSKFGT